MLAAYSVEFCNMKDQYLLIIFCENCTMSFNILYDYSIGDINKDSYFSIILYKYILLSNFENALLEIFIFRKNLDSESELFS